MSTKKKKKKFIKSTTESGVNRKQSQRLSALHKLQGAHEPQLAFWIPGIQQLHLTKRQSTDRVLVIPTTYANLNNSPAPGAVVGATLGAVFGFILALFLLVQALRLAGYGVAEEIVEETRCGLAADRPPPPGASCPAPTRDPSCSGCACRCCACW